MTCQHRIPSTGRLPVGPGPDTGIASWHSRQACGGMKVPGLSGDPRHQTLWSQRGAVGLHRTARVKNT